MQIELLLGVLPGSPPATDSPGATTDAPPDGASSFAALLDAAADESDRSDADDAGAVDEWIALPLLATVTPSALDASDSAISSSEGTASFGESVSGTPVVGELLAGQDRAAGDSGVPATHAGMSSAPGPLQSSGDAPVHDSDPIGQTTGGPGSARDLPREDVANDARPGANVRSKAREVAQDAAAADAADPQAATPAADTAAAAQAFQRAPSNVESSAGGSPATAAGQVAARESIQEHKGAAARFARALERAADPSAIPPAVAAASEDGESFDPGGGQQRSLGEWLREQLPLPASGRGQSVAAPVFTTAALHRDGGTQGVPSPFGAEPAAAADAIADERSVARQLVQSLRVQFRDGIGEAVLRLKPEHLGSLAILLKVENGGLKASVQAERPAVRQWLESNQDTLRHALAEHGLRLDRFDVDPEGHRQPTPQDRDEQSARRHRHRQSQQQDEPVFEVIV